MEVHAASGGAVPERPTDHTQEEKFGIERSFDRRTFPDGALYSNAYFLDGASYHGPYHSAGAYRGITISGRTLTIRMARPFPEMPYWASWPQMGPIPLGRVSDPATYKNHPLASGPYKIASYTPSKSLVLVRNPQWDPDTDPGRHQYVDRWVFHFNEDASAIDQQLLSPAASARSVVSYNSLTASEIARFKRRGPAHLTSGAEPCTFALYPDMRTMTDVRVRRALAYAYPYRAVLRAQGQELGVTASFASSFMSPDVLGRVAYNPVPGHRLGATDPAKARALLSQAHAVGFPIRWAYAEDDPVSVTVKNLMVQALRRAGFDPQPIRTTSIRLGPDYVGNPAADVNLRIAGWCSDWPTGLTWMPSVFESPRLVPAVLRGNLDGNFEDFSNSAADTRMAAIQRLPLDQQPAAWSALERWIQTRYLPVIPTAFHATYQAYGSDVRGDFLDPMYGMPTFEDIWVG